MIKYEFYAIFWHLVRVPGGKTQKVPKPVSQLLGLRAESYRRLLLLIPEELARTHLDQRVALQEAGEVGRGTASFMSGVSPCDLLTTRTHCLAQRQHVTGA